MNVVTEKPAEPTSARLPERIKQSIRSAAFGENLKAKVFRGGAWLGAGSLSEQALRFGRNMLLTRLLAPEAFGTMAIVLSCTTVIHTIMDIGVREGLIQNSRGSEDEYVGAAWWMSFGRGVSFWLSLSVIAPFVARFYANPELTALFRVAAIGVLLDGAISAKAYVAIREMKFRKWALINHGGAILGVFVTIGLSYFIRDVWALVIGYAAESLGRMILSFVICPYVPPRRWDGAAVRDLLKFSKKAFGLSIFSLIFSRTDIFVLGKLHSAADLGIYSMAIYLVQTPTSFLMNLLSQTLLPTFSQVQNDNGRTNRIFSQVTSALVLLGMPALVFIFFCGHSLLTLFYGSRYASASGPLIVASLVALINAVNGQITLIFYAKGQPHLHRRCVILMAVTMIVCIYPSIQRFGIVGAQLAALLAISIGFVFQIIRVRPLIDLDLTQYSKLCVFAGGISVGVAAICLSARSFASFNHPLPNVLFGMLGCALAYALVLGFFFRDTLKATA